MKNNISTKLLEKLLNQAAIAGDINTIRALLIAGAPLDESTIEVASESDPIKAGILSLDIAHIQQGNISVSDRLKVRCKLLGLNHA